MGRPLLYATAILIRMTAQMRAAIEVARRDGETAADVVRVATERELMARNTRQDDRRTTNGK